MLQNHHCMALRSVRYDDRRAILSAWSAEAGRISLSVPDGSSREARRRRAVMMPFALFEGQADIRPDRDIHSMRDIRPMAILPAITSSPAKTAVAIFLADVLHHVLRETSPDPLLSSFIFDAARALDAASPRGTANFPVVFLYRLARFLGFSPDPGAWRPGAFFYMPAASFTLSPPLTAHGAPDSDVLVPAEAACIPMLERVTPAVAQRLRLPLEMRRRMLAHILRYYSLHHTPVDNLRSHQILSELF